jgi:hypothetical protein
VPFGRREARKDFYTWPSPKHEKRQGFTFNRIPGVFAVLSAFALKLLPLRFRFYPLAFIP